MAQSLVTYNVLTKNIALLDQMRKGLSMLGLLKEIERYPHLFEHFFVYQGGKLTPSFVKICLTDLEDVCHYLIHLLTAVMSKSCQIFLHLLQGVDLKHGH